MRPLVRPRPRQDHGAMALAPLVDVFTLLLLVLLRAWSTDPPLPLSLDELALPTAVGHTEAPRQTTIDVGRSGIYLDGVRVASTSWYAEHDDTVVVELVAPLRRTRTTQVALRTDQSTPYRVIRKVLLAVREADVSEVAVVSTDRGSL